MPHSAVVRIYSTEQEPDYDSPWQARSPSSSTGSGVLIGPRLILTGAHVIANSTFIQVQKIHDPNKYVARVVGVCHDADLALLELDDPAFMKGTKPAKIGSLPARRDRVAVVGFPVGGDEVSITEGVVSRIEVQRYAHSQRFLLAVTIDAAINSGNSGGPVFRNGEVVGIAFQKLNDADGIGEMVPPPIIKNFLKAVKKEKHIRIPTIGVATQNLENPMLRERLGMHKDESGVLVLRTEYGSSAHGVLKEGDTLLSIGGSKIANNSTVLYRRKHRTRFDVIMGEKQVGETIKLRILRDGKRQVVSLTLRPKVELVPRSQYDVTPSYFIYAGLVFQTLSRDYLSTWDTWWEKAPKEFLHLYYAGIRTEERQEAVILSQILADEINVGYEGLYSECVTSVNGKKPRDLKHFVELVEGSPNRLELVTSSRALVVLDKEKVAERSARILERYKIERDRSADLQPQATVLDIAKAKRGKASKASAKTKSRPSGTRKAASAKKAAASGKGRSTRKKNKPTAAKKKRGS